MSCVFLFQAEDGIRDLVRSRGLGDVYKRQGQPTVVQNVETLVNVPHIILNGAEWYASIGTEKSSGPKIFCISGHVNRPGIYELPLGTPLRTIIDEYAGGVRHGHTIKAIIPGGVSTNLVLPQHLDVPMSFEGLEAVSYTHLTLPTSDLG